jgi:hypothetical protein
MEGGTLLAIPGCFSNRYVPIKMPRCPRTELQSPLPFTIPVPGELLPDGFWVLENLLQRGKTFAYYSRTTDCVPGALWRWFM